MRRWSRVSGACCLSAERASCFSPGISSDSGVFGQLSMIPMLGGLILFLLGRRHARILWFPVAFLIFMVPIPPSLTQSIVLHIKLLATEAAVRLAQLATLPIIRDGSFVHFGDDQLLVGEVCGGLRSLIALLAFGALMCYISKTRLWARILILAVSGPHRHHLQRTSYFPAVRCRLFLEQRRRRGQGA